MKSSTLKYALPCLVALLAVTWQPAVGYDLLTFDPDHRLSFDADYKGYGNNPDFTVVIDNSASKITFTMGGESTTHKFSKTGPALIRGERIHVFRGLANDHSMQVVVKGKSCQDNMTGRIHETMVTVYHEGEVYPGCGDVLNTRVW